LLDEVRSGSRWIWHPQGTAAALATAAVVGGLVSVAIAALAGSPLLAGAAAVLSSGLLALVVLRFRRETWRVRADGLKMVVWQPGI
jgi:hypothetical protein